MTRKFTFRGVEWEVWLTGHAGRIADAGGITGITRYDVRFRPVGGSASDELPGRISKNDVLQVDEGECRHELLRSIEISRCWGGPSTTKVSC